MTAAFAAVLPRASLTETPIEPVPSSRRLITGVMGFSRRRPANGSRRETMRLIANALVTTSLVVVTALAARRCGRPTWTPVRRSTP